VTRIPKHEVDELAQAIFEVLRRYGRLKQPGAIAVMAGLANRRITVTRKSGTVWQDYRSEARALLAATLR